VLHEPEFRWALLAPRFWPTWCVIGLLWIGWLLPWRVRGWIADIAALVYVSLPSRRKANAIVNLALCYPELPERSRYELFRRNARVFCHANFHLGALAFGNPSHIARRFTVHPPEAIRNLVATDRPVILVAAHWLANEYLHHYIASCVPLVGLLRPNRNALLDWAETRMRARSGTELFSVWSPMISAIRRVQQGRWLIYGPDVDAGRFKHVFAPFFGIPKATTPTLARLASTCDSIVVPVAVTYTPTRGRFELILYDPLGEKLSAEHMNGCLETMIRAHPDQYAWSIKLYKTRQDNLPAPYAPR